MPGSVTLYSLPTQPTLAISLELSAFLSEIWSAVALPTSATL